MSSVPDTVPAAPKVSEILRTTATPRLWRWRRFKDVTATRAVAIGGVSVIIAIVLIAFYLLYVVFPMFLPASIEPAGSYAAPGGAGRTLHLALEEQAEVGVRFTGDGRAVFFAVETGEIVKEVPLAVPAGAQIRSLAHHDPVHGGIAFGLDDGRVLVARHAYTLSYPGGRRLITPGIEYPLGEAPLTVGEGGEPLDRLALASNDSAVMVAAVTGQTTIRLARFAKQTSFLDPDAVTLERDSGAVMGAASPLSHLLLSPDGRWLYAMEADGHLNFIDLADPAAPKLVQRITAVPPGASPTVLRFLLGGLSVLVGDSQGRVAQWFPVRGPSNEYTLERVRAFDAQEAPITDIAPEHRRKGFLAADANGTVAVYYTTSERTLLTRNLGAGPLAGIAIAPRGDALLAVGGDGRVHRWRVHNEHPEISWSSLWGEVWYESHEQPKYMWQSSAANNDFEPKFSLMPLAFGTLKAAFYAMLVAMPLAIMGAIYTAHFMDPRMRSTVKPVIEIMEALPTVILGFLAGLWLAPVIEDYMPGIFALLVVLPGAMLLAAWLWHRAPGAVRQSVPEGWEAALLVPVVLVAGWAAFAVSQPLELWLFGGNMPGWLTTELGIDFDQRNSIVVGLAMGFAVVPTIFSITEDAVFSVPKHLVHGSLALGATPWQTMVKVVLLTASPGIFSAVMIGLGRAVGETMIVLMATGNTPVMDMSIFQGMRTLSANIAVEMPESEVGSSHYRVLFLAAFVLFAFTFVVNTAAELVRQRLRVKYSSL